jgi:long-chain acyl-CoA synthetase
MSESSAKNLTQLFQDAVSQRGDSACWKYKSGDAWKTLSWNDVRDKVAQVAGGLRSLGVEPGDKVVLLSKTRYEWSLADFGILATQAVTVPIYESNTAEQASYIIKDSGAKVAFVENASQLKKIREIWSRHPELKAVVVFEGGEGEGQNVYSLKKLKLMGGASGEEVFQEALENGKPEDMASIVYTSGTTGEPKGAVLLHQNFLSEIYALQKAIEFPKNESSLMILPLAHILARVLQFAQVAFGFVQCYAESIKKIAANITEVKPYFVLGVPRIFEKIHTKTMAGVETSSPLKQRLFHWALDVGTQVYQLSQSGQSPSFTLQIQHALAKKLVHSKLKKRLGGKMKFFISGGAPLSYDVALFFCAFGFKVLEGYGLTETTAAASVGTFEHFRVGTVGKPIDGVHVKVAEDGELLVKGDVVFKEYYNKPEETEAAFRDGWFCTGDIGEFDQDGFLKITDRKKDMIVTAGGKNIAPQSIENLLKLDPLISQAVVHGDKRRFLSALIVLDREELEAFAKDQGYSATSYDDLIHSQQVYDVVENRVKKINKTLARYETIKKFAILPNEFTVESGELTPTMKVKRKAVGQNHAAVLDAFYTEESDLKSA